MIYDIETFPNCFTFFGIYQNQEFTFEISDRKDERSMLVSFMNEIAKKQIKMVGFNNYGFDYPVIHFIYKNHKIITINDIYEKAMSIISNFDARFQHIIWDNDQIVPQVDLFKIHHFDNKAKMTSLKVLEFNMRSDSVEDLPFPVGTILNDEQKDVLIKYNRHDVLQTEKFFYHSASQIMFREELSKKYNRNFINHNDTKIGKDYFIMILEENNPGVCYKVVNGKKTTVQTIREEIVLKDIILPYIKFERPEFTNILNFFKSKSIKETMGIFSGLNCMVEQSFYITEADLIFKPKTTKKCSINNFRFDFGTGGIHGSVKKQAIYADKDYILQDWDVASYYPNLAIVNNFYPEHLGLDFCEIYKDVYEQRKRYKKGTSENAMLKLALNGVYGDSNNQYSPFYDPQYTMSITINGQLLLCMMVDQLLKIPNLELIQINTDGLTIKYPRLYTQTVCAIMKEWETLTGLTLENVEYSKMFIRDVNNYIAQDVKGKAKRKGAYDFNLGWHQNHSALIIPKAASEFLINNTPVELYIRSHTDLHDFMLRTKIQRSHTLLWGGDKVQNTTRYYISTDGDILEKLLPAAGPVGAFKRANGLLESYYQSILSEVGEHWDARIHTKNKSKYEERKTSIQQGWTVQVCNNIKDFTFNDLNYDYYIEKAIELIKDAGGKL